MHNKCYIKGHEEDKDCVPKFCGPVSTFTVGQRSAIPNQIRDCIQTNQALDQQYLGYAIEMIRLSLDQLAVLKVTKDEIDELKALADKDLKDEDKVKKAIVNVASHEPETLADLLQTNREAFAAVLAEVSKSSSVKPNPTPEGSGEETKSAGLGFTDTLPPPYSGQTNSSAVSIYSGQTNSSAVSTNSAVSKAVGSPAPVSLSRIIGTAGIVIAVLGVTAAAGAIGGIAYWSHGLQKQSVEIKEKIRLGKSRLSIAVKDEEYRKNMVNLRKNWSRGCEQQ